jgi:hypothetical protein
MANAVVTLQYKRRVLSADIPGMGTVNLKIKADGQGWVDKKNKGFEVFFDTDDSGDVTAMRIDQTRILPRDG